MSSGIFSGYLEIVKERIRGEIGMRTAVNKRIRSWMTKPKTCNEGQDKLVADDLRLLLTLRKCPLGMPSKPQGENSKQYYMCICSGVQLDNNTFLG